MVLKYTVGLVWYWSVTRLIWSGIEMRSVRYWSVIPLKLGLLLVWYFKILVRFINWGHWFLISLIGSFSSQVTFLCTTPVFKKY